MKLTGAQILIETLIEQGVDTIFGYPGGSVLDIYDELYKNADRINHVISAHEQGAAHAAEGYARASGRLGVVLATSGPGATNLVTGIADANLDSTPLLAITGNVGTAVLGSDGFQEVDIVGVTYPIVKHSYQVKDVTKLADTIREAMQIAQSGRPGPVLIDIPKDVQLASTEFKNKEKVALFDNPPFDEALIDKAVEMIAQSKRPFIYCGGGAAKERCCHDIMAFSEKIDAPIGTSMMGLASIPASFKNGLGMCGMHGHYASTAAMYESDLIIAMGVRFSDRATGDKKKFSLDKKIIHIDIDPAEISKNISVNLGITGDLKEVLAAINEKTSESKKPEWMAKIDEFRKYEEENTYISPNKLTPYDIIDAVNAIKDEYSPVSTDVGQHQLWTSQRNKVHHSKTFITSGGLGTMGFGMGAAIGAAVATGRTSILYTGDGSFGMNLNELATAVSQNLPLVVVLFNNGVLGNVRQWQTMFYGERYSQTTLNRKTDFVKLAEAFGAKGFRADDKDSLNEALKEAFASKSPCVVECIIDKDEMVLPMIPPGKSIDSLLMRFR
ncbi:MAG: biosynthetic-type acetolactate synthase large subunit [Clostridia bacterium]|nr:biosynthetic-type acetolactate synthase large subunit [Clostridia bacterium]